MIRFMFSKKLERRRSKNISKAAKLSEFSFLHLKSFSASKKSHQVSQRVWFRPTGRTEPLAVTANACLSEESSHAEVPQSPGEDVKSKPLFLEAEIDARPRVSQETEGK